MIVTELVLRTMTKGEYRTHYKKGNSNFYLRNNEDTYFLEKITKGCSACVCCGDVEKINSFIEENKLKMVEILHI